ncbi:MAG: response regulator [Candidatus Caldatribacterium sp.]|nr:response regulator [Candidatus Caldatribacterium sp.]
MVSNGREALGCFEENPHRYRIIITDLVMPEMDGFDLITAIRNRSPYVYPYIIVLSGHGEEEFVIKALRLGADNFLEKPVSAKKLAAYIASGLQKLTWLILDIFLELPSKILEFQDEYTGKHIRDTRIVAFLLAKAYSERYDVGDPSFPECIQVASAFHDIGKIVLPDSLLKKAGPYTPEERQAMERHTLYGARLLEEAVSRHPENKILRTCYEVALFHHERWDGSGYPYGLRGEEIPLSARIVAVADVFNALTSNRHYRPAYSLEEAFALLERERERYDPKVLSLLFEYQGFFGAMKKRRTD